MSNSVTCQLVHQVAGDVVRVGVQRSDMVYFGFIDVRISACVADYITLLIDSRHGSTARYLHPARHELATPRRTRSNETFVVVLHQSLKLGIADLRHNAAAATHDDDHDGDNNNNNNNKATGCRYPRMMRSSCTLCSPFFFWSHCHPARSL